MTGATEILVLVFLILAILILPRVLNPKQQTKSEKRFKPLKLGAATRAGIILSLVYPAVHALYWKPWEDGLIPFLGFGLLPVFIAWSIKWVLSAKK